MDLAQDDAAGLFREADQEAERVSVDDAGFDFLYRHSRVPMPRAEWDRHVQCAYAIDGILRARYRKILSGEVVVPGWVDVAAATEMLAASRGSLLLTFHGGFTWIARMLFAAAGRGRQVTGSFPGGNLFAALRELQAGRSGFIGPDGIYGRTHATIVVLGRSFRVGTGAAYLAYETQCPTRWYTVKREGDRFVPICEAGPQRRQDETLDQFTDRLLGFYAAKVEEAMTAHPAGLILTQRWVSVFGKPEEVG